MLAFLITTMKSVKVLIIPTLLAVSLICFGIIIFIFKSSDADGIPQQQSVSPLIFEAENAGVTLSWKNISVDITGSFFGPKTRIISEISGQAGPGEIVAIFGPSGCGKTTLLNALAGWLQRSVVSGSITVNGQNREESTWSCILGYVEQVNNINSVFTVRKNMEIIASMKIAGSQNARDDKINQLLQSLQLEDCSETIVQLISGGQKKRLAIALELISDPMLLFLDEPTSGLDSSLTFQIVELLKEYAAKYHKTIVMTIHQPREDLLPMFSKLVILTKGFQIFYGSLAEARNFFKKSGIENEKNINFADFVLDAVSIDSRTKESIAKSNDKIEFLKSTWKSRIAPTLRDSSDHDDDAADVALSNRGIKLIYDGPFLAIPKLRDPLPLWDQFLALLVYHYSTLSHSMLFSLTVVSMAYGYLQSKVAKLSAYPTLFETFLFYIFMQVPGRIRTYRHFVITSRRMNLYNPLIYVGSEILFTLFIHMGFVLGSFIFKFIMIRVNHDGGSVVFASNKRNIMQFFTITFAVINYNSMLMMFSYLVPSETIFNIVNIFLMLFIVADVNNYIIMIDAMKLQLSFIRMILRVLLPFNFNHFFVKAYDMTIMTTKSTTNSPSLIFWIEKCIPIFIQIVAWTFLLILVFLLSTCPNLNLAVIPTKRTMVEADTMMVEAH